VVELTLTLAREMLAAAGVSGKDPADALKDGSAMDVWRRMISAQGGDPDAALPSARENHVVVAPSSGVLTRLDAYGVGVAAWRLGAGRARKEDPVSFAAGITCHAKPGDRVAAGQPLLTLHADDESRFARALESLDGAYSIEENGTPELHPLVLDRIS
jgi:thymidine phosphorylase